MKHVLSPADILFNRYMKTRMSSVLEAAVRATGDLGMHKETDKAKQTAQSASQPPELAVLGEVAGVIGAHGRDHPGAAGAWVGWCAIPCLEKVALETRGGPRCLLSHRNQQRRAGASRASLRASSSKCWRGRSLFGGPERTASFISEFEI